MSRFINCLRNFLPVPKKATINRDELSAVANGWQLHSLERPPLKWDSKEIDLLLQCEKYKSFCTAQFHNSTDAVQTVLLGLDLNSNSLLLDEFFPRSPLSRSHQTFTLTITTQSGILVIDAMIDETIYLRGGPALLCEVRSKRFSRDRRSNSRIQFPKDNAPSTKLVLPLLGQLTGTLIDLSPEGLMMQCYTEKKPTLYSQTGDCTVHISELFILCAKIRVKTVRYKRRPYCHSVVRAIFEELSQHQKDRISAFIQQYPRADDTQAA